MKFEMQKANMLAENIIGFMNFVQRSSEYNTGGSNTDQLYRLKLLVKEFQFKILAEELLRVNRYTWDEKYTRILVDRIRHGINTIDEYIQNNSNELFMFIPRVYTVKANCAAFSSV